MEPKNRSPQITTIMNELESEFAKIIKDSPSYIMLAEKFASLNTSVDNAVRKKCIKELEEADKYISIEQVDNQPKFNIKPGMEKQADNAMKNLETCQHEFSATVMAINVLYQNSQAVLSGTVDNCIDACERSGDNANMRPCIKNCYNFAYNYMFDSSTNLLVKNLDMAINEVKKL